MDSQDINGALIASNELRFNMDAEFYPSSERQVEDWYD
jgi:hypothetical protein